MLRTEVKKKNGSHEMSTKKKVKFFWVMVDISKANVNQKSKKFE